MGSLTWDLAFHKIKWPMTLAWDLGRTNLMQSRDEIRLTTLASCAG